MLLRWRFFSSVPIMVQSQRSSGSLALKLREPIILAESLIQMIGRFQSIVSCLQWKDGGYIQWIVLLVIIIRRFASFSLDFGTQVVARWIFSCKIWKVRIASLFNCKPDCQSYSLFARFQGHCHYSRVLLAVVIFLVHYFQNIFQIVSVLMLLLQSKGVTPIRFWVVIGSLGSSCLFV